MLDLGNFIQCSSCGGAWFSGVEMEKRENHVVSLSDVVSGPLIGSKLTK